MKIVYVGNFVHKYDTETYVANALERAGCSVFRVNEKYTRRDELLHLLKEELPDLLLFAKFRLDRSCWERNRDDVIELLREIRTAGLCKVIACWVFDLLSPMFRTRRWRWAKFVSRECDCFFTTDGYTLPALQRNANAILLRQGVPDDAVPIGKVGLVRSQPPLLFLGSLYGDRADDLQEISKHFGPRFARAMRIRGAALNVTLQSTSLVIGPKYPEFARYWSNRLYVVTGYGGCFFAPDVPGMRAEGWRDGENFIASHRPSASGLMAPVGESVVQYIETLLVDPDRIERIRKQGQQFAMQNHSYDNRVRELLEYIESKP